MFQRTKSLIGLLDSLRTPNAQQVFVGDPHHAHSGTFTRLHAGNRILKHQSPRPLRTLSLPDPSVAIVLIRANRAPQRTRSREEYIRERLPAACAVVAAADDMLPKARKDVLQMRRLALVIAPYRAGGDGDGHAVRGEVLNEPRDAR